VNTAVPDSDKISAAPILVVGADALVGRGLADGLAAGGAQVYRTTRRRVARPNDILLDLADPAFMRVPLPEVGTAFLCASVNGFADCRADPAAAFRINVDATAALARRLVERGCHVIGLSSSAVFDFSKARQPANAPVCPTTVYGETKAASEKALLALGGAASVVRLTKVLTPDTPRFSTWLDSLRHGDSIAAFSDLRFCPISLDFVVRALIRIMSDRGDGIYQLSGADDLSYAQAMRHLARRMGLDEDRVIADGAAAHGIPPEEIATYTSLDMSRYTALSGEEPPQPFEVLDGVFGRAIEPLVACDQ
jgi:dTDP-4-dehydrorhamnose reductase